MKLLNLKDMADGKIPVPVGKMVNIRLSKYDGDPDIKPAFRKLISVEWRKAKKDDVRRGDHSRWLYWTWESQGTIPSIGHDITDCGYSGIRESALETEPAFISIEENS